MDLVQKQEALTVVKAEIAVHDDSEDDDGFVALPARNAHKTAFPPGCSVLVPTGGIMASPNDESPPTKQQTEVWLPGSVADVGIDWDTRETAYKIQLLNAIVVVREKHLRYATGTAVWFSATEQDTPKSNQGIVIGSTDLPLPVQQLLQETTGEHHTVQYSIQSVTSQQTGPRLFHGVLQNRVSFRAASADAEPKPSTAESKTELSKATERDELASNEENTKKPGELPSVEKNGAEMNVAPSATLIPTDTGSAVSGLASQGIPWDDKKKSPVAGTAEISVTSTKTSADTIMGSHLHKRDVQSSPPQKTTGTTVVNSPVSMSSLSAVSSTVTDTSKVRQHQPRLQPPSQHGSQDTRLHNNNPSPFQRIVFGRGHDFGKAFAMLRTIRARHGCDMSVAGGMGEIVNNSCLWWQFRGKCRDNCPRGDNHVTLSREEARALEEAVAPLISDTGPIFCAPDTGMNDRRGYQDLQHSRSSHGNDNPHIPQRANAFGANEVQREPCDYRKRSLEYYRERDNTDYEQRNQEKHNRQHHQMDDGIRHQKRARTDDSFNNSSGSSHKHSPQGLGGPPRDSNAASSPSHEKATYRELSGNAGTGGKVTLEILDSDDEEEVAAPTGLPAKEPISSPDIMPYPVMQPAGKCKLVLHAVPSISILGSSGAHMPVSIVLVDYFGVEFYSHTVMGKDGSLGRLLCDRHSCRIDIEGTLVRDIDRAEPYRGIDRVVVKLTGPSLQKLFACRLALERILCNALPLCLRGYLLWNMAWRNSYREKDKGIVHTRNPFLEQPNHGGSDDNLQHMALLKAGKASKCTGNLKETVYSLSKVAQWKDDLREQFPCCRIEAVDVHEEFPKIYPHILVCSSSFEDVLHCRREMRHLVQQEHQQPF